MPFYWILANMCFCRFFFRCHAYTISLLEPWFQLILEINLFQSLIFLYFTHCILNNRRVLHDFRIDDIKAKPPDCSCHNYLFKYSHVGNIIMDDLNIIYWTNDGIILAKGSKYRDSQSINWKHIFNILINSQKMDRSRKRGGWCLSKWVKPLCHLFKCKSENQERLMSAKATSVFKDPDVAENLSTNSRQICSCFAVTHIRPLIILFFSALKALHLLLKDIIRLG